MDKKTLQTINFMENLALKIEKSLDIVLEELENNDKLIKNYKGNRKIIDAELEKNEIIQRVNDKLDKLVL